MSRTSKLSAPRTPVTPLHGGQGGIGDVAHVADNYSASPSPKPGRKFTTTQQCEGIVQGRKPRPGHGRSPEPRKGLPCRSRTTLLTVEGGWRCLQHPAGLTL